MSVDLVMNCGMTHGTESHSSTPVRRIAFMQRHTSIRVNPHELHTTPDESNDSRLHAFIKILPVV